MCRLPEGYGNCASTKAGSPVDDCHDDYNDGYDDDYKDRHGTTIRVTEAGAQRLGHAQFGLGVDD